MDPLMIRLCHFVRLGLRTLLLASLLTSQFALGQAPPPPTPASESQLKEAVKAAEQSHGAVSEETAVAWRDLADFFWSEQRLAETADALSRSLAIAESLKPDGFGVTRLMQNLASVYTTGGQPERAVPLLVRALSIREKLLGTDHTDLAVVLLNLGDAYRLLGDFQQARTMMLRALAIREKGLEPNHPDIAWATSYLGRLYRELGDFPQALSYFERTLSIREKALGNSHRFVSRSLSDLALVYRDMGNHRAALPLLERALGIDRQNLGPAHPDLVSALSSVGLLQRDLGHYDLALEAFERAYAIDLQTVGPRHSRVASRLGELGSVYLALGDRARAISLYEQALAIEEGQARPLPSAIAARLLELGGAYSRSGDQDRALAMLLRANAINEGLYGTEHLRIADGMERLALVYRASGKGDLADASISRALQIEEKFGGRTHPRMAAARAMAGLIFQSNGSTEAATNQFRQALAIASRGDQPETLWQAQRGLASLASLNGEGELSIYWGKRSVNTIESLRGQLGTLTPDLQRFFLLDKRAVYVSLADQLIAAGRLAEAQDVLAMLKEEELFDYTARSGDEGARGTRANFVGPTELSADQRWLEITTQLAQLGRESSELSRRTRLGLSAAEEQRRVQVEADLVLANQRFDSFVSELSREFVAAGARRAEEFGARQLRNLVVMQDVLGELGRDAVLLHYVVAQNRVAIIVTTAEVQIAREARIDATDLNRKVLEFRQSIAARRDVTGQAKELYRLLVGPVADDLRQSGAHTLLLSLDGTLRYLPFAALNDGRRWLAETYSLSIYTEAARSQLARQPQKEWTMTGLGLTHAVPGFAALPAVREELEGIRRSGMPGDVYLDEEFTADRLRDVLAGSRPVMHIASHFQFRPGTYANSFLVLGNGQRLTLQEIRDRRMRFSSVELLTLSACDTAMGGGLDETGAEVEGFGALAQQQGARAVLATLWPVADGSTSRFMQVVYGGRQANRQLSTAEALRQAQLSFLRTTAKSPGKPDPRLAHPFYWAGYVLMGNFR
ncbi:MAG: tetratricopeptide repeat protein [Caldimonas sp.]